MYTLFCVRQVIVSKFNISRWTLVTTDITRDVSQLLFDEQEERN